ncbi:lactate dehydrogenase [Fructilactobacillus florum]|uniref:Malate lactate dehydrogenase n=1 Tax=Fructilactobacillus florum DSM 22689 = JCM 16035 TaxID=1423745 RepID=A0A0R2CJL5_9LACO|nr:lactate dehydrogenase [Fructilactobacillus florum]KRM91671.1 malate lactate dehydrogenase [Fructilactobacillus florum DSM 22689 = JCM 16035]
MLNYYQISISTKRSWRLIEPLQIMIVGDQQRIRQFIQTLIMHDWPLKVIVTDLAAFEPEVVAQRGCRRFQLQSVSTDLTKTAVVIWLPDTTFFDAKVVEPTEVALSLRTMIDELRSTVNRLISAGFAGKMIFDVPHDEIFTYFAAYFSGFAVEQIIGVGTLPQEMLLRNELCNRLGVASDDLNVNTLGLNTNSFVAWSRIYLGSMNLLSYLKSEDNNLDLDLLEELQATISDQAIVGNEIIQQKAILKLLDALFYQHAILYTGVGLKKNKDQLQLALVNRIINTKGMQHELQLPLSDQEAQDLATDLDFANEVITAIKKENSADGTTK